jgi:hypothetical protein
MGLVMLLSPPLLFSRASRVSVEENMLLCVPACFLQHRVIRCLFGHHTSPACMYSKVLMPCRRLEYETVPFHLSFCVLVCQGVGLWRGWSHCTAGCGSCIASMFHPLLLVFTTLAAAKTVVSDDGYLRQQMRCQHPCFISGCNQDS